MEKLRDKHGKETVERALRFLSIRARSRPESAPLAAEVDAARREVAAADDAWKEARETRVAATAELGYLDDRLDRLMIALSQTVLIEAGGKRKSDKHKKLFPVAASEAMKPEGASEQAAFVGKVLEQLATPEYESVRSHAAPIAGAFEALAGSERRRDALYVPEATALGQREAALDRARRTYNLASARLMLIFPDERTLVDSYFLDLRGASGDEPPAGAGAEAGAGGAPTS